MSREQADTREFVSILSEDGTFRLKVPEGTEGAVVRKGEVNGTPFEKTELAFKALTGFITKVELQDSTFDRDGKKVTIKFLQVTIKDDAGELTISTPASSSFAQSLMKLLPAMDFTQEYRLAPYSFDNDKGKTVKGISVSEAGDKDKKIKNFFFDPKTEKNINGFPEPTGDTKKYTKNKWKAYFGDVEDFLIEYTEKNIVPKFAEVEEDIEKDALDNF